MISGFFDFFLLFFALSFLDFSGGSSFLLFSYAILFVLFDCFSFTLLVVDTSLVSFKFVSSLTSFSSTSSLSLSLILNSSVTSSFSISFKSSRELIFFVISFVQLLWLCLHNIYQVFSTDGCVLGGSSGQCIKYHPDGLFRVAR